MHADDFAEQAGERGVEGFPKYLHAVSGLEADDFLEDVNVVDTDDESDQHDKLTEVESSVAVSVHLSNPLFKILSRHHNSCSHHADDTLSASSQVKSSLSGN